MPGGPARGPRGRGPKLTIEAELADDLAAIERGLCSERQQEKCLVEFGEDGREWACRRCPQRRWQDLSPYTHKLLRLRHLRQAGYPLACDDLTVDEWMDLGRLEEVMAAATPRPIPVFMVKPKS